MEIVARARLLVASAIIGGWSGPPAVATCLQYGPAPMTVSGTVVMQQAYGAPNYGEDPEHDDIEVYPLLVLDHQACVSKDPYEPAEWSVTVMQMVFLPPALLKKDWIGRHVTVVGTLFHANTGHHRTPVLIEPSSVALTAPPEMKPRIGKR